MQKNQRTDNAVIVEFAGGLGNQLFQYAFYQFLQTQLDRPLYLDTTAVQRDIRRKLIISEFDFDQSIFINTRRELYRILKSRVDTSLSKIEKVINIFHPYLKPEDSTTFFLLDDDMFSTQYLKNKHDIEVYIQKVLDAINAHPNEPVYIRGYWQYALIQDKNIELGVAPLKYTKSVSSNINDVYYEIKNAQTPTCSVHLRRGDFLLNVVQQELPTVDMSYYTNSVSYILERHPDTMFYIFSDEPKWCAEHIDFIDNMKIVSGNISNIEIEDLILMNACEHHILANSSFSWWGAMMPAVFNQSNGNVDHSIIIAPKIWFSNEIKNMLVINDKWVRI